MTTEHKFKVGDRVGYCVTIDVPYNSGTLRVENLKYSEENPELGTITAVHIDGKLSIKWDRQFLNDSDYPTKSTTRSKIDRFRKTS